jgi:hypothetical protein
MKNTLKVLFCMAAIAVLITPTAGAEEVSLTVYNQNFGFVRVIREMELARGISEVDFKDVAESIDPTSVHFRSLTDPDGTMILEQNYEYDLVSSSKLYNKFLGKEISVKTEEKSFYQGTLGSVDGGQLVLLDAVRFSPGEEKRLPVVMLRMDRVVDVQLPQLPEGLITIPTLKWLLDAGQAGSHEVEVSYIASNMNWHADYTAVLEEDDKQMDLAGWITVDNQSGAAYKDAKLKLLAGDVHRVQEDRRRARVGMDMLAMAEKAAPQVQQKEFFEYHLYTLQRPTTLKDRQTKQIEFTKAPEVPIRKRYILEAQNPYQVRSTQDMKVDVKLVFQNKEEGGLGIPLPKGKVRVFKRDTDGSLEFIGEDRIDHTPKDEKVELQVGKAFDIVGERKQVDFSEDPRYFREEFQVQVRNHKKEPVKVSVIEHFYRWSEWDLYTDAEYEKIDSQTVEFVLDVPRDATGEINYTVRYEKRS